MNKKISAYFSLLTIILIAAFFGFIFLRDQKNNEISSNNGNNNGGISEMKACTQEAKQCPDGSYVSRTGPSCDFSQCPKSGEDNNVQMANPASVFCEKNGGKLEIRTGKDGGQVGYCKFSEGKECEEWAFFRGECKK